jgi:hypothetical protein
VKFIVAKQEMFCHKIVGSSTLNLPVRLAGDVKMYQQEDYNLDNLQTLSKCKSKPLWAWISAITLIVLLSLFSGHKAHSSEKTISIDKKNIDNTRNN